MRGRRRTALLLALLVVLGIVGGLAVGWRMLETQPLRGGIAGCADVRRPHARIACLQERAVQVANADGEARALEQLRSAVASEPIECHLAVHVLGERAGRRDGRSGFVGSARDVELEADEPCDQGWIHGYLSLVFDDVTDEQLGPALVLCDDVATRRGECDHALGHALERAHRAGKDDPLRRCELLAATTDAPEDAAAAARVHDCRHGAVMEAALLDVRAEDPPVDTCRGEQDAPSRTSCYEFLVARALLLGEDWEQAAARCVALGDRRDRATCNRGYTLAAPDEATCGRHPDRRVRRACEERVA